MQKKFETLKDEHYLQIAIKLALDAETNGNLPIGAIIVLDDYKISEGKNSIFSPIYQPHHHAEIEALRSIPHELLNRSRDMTCYTTLEPCVMCMATLVIYEIGRIVFGANDPMGGGKDLGKHLPEYYHSQLPVINGPAMPEVCDPLFLRAKKVFLDLKKGQPR